MVAHHKHLTRHLATEQDTLALGAALAPGLRPGTTLFLTGNLGAGKTTLVRGLLHGLGFEGRVKSPTFTLVEPYTISSLYLYHFDFYRFNRPNEWLDSGFRDYFNSASICLVEWPEKAGGHLPAPDLKIDLAIAGTGRDATISAHTEVGNACLTHLED
jgi:tRNA threonylcarbamoyladenosine biosynthesis protein TsaE